VEGDNEIERLVAKRHAASVGKDNGAIHYGRQPVTVLPGHVALK